MTQARLGIIGTGMLGGAIARRLLAAGYIAPDGLMLANRSGSAKGFADWPEIRIVNDMQVLADACDTILLAMPPAATAGFRIEAGNRLVVSVMAGVSLAQLSAMTGSPHVVRAMSSPAAEIGLAYSPWTASPSVTGDDRATVAALFSACGTTDEVGDESQIECFTALTGPVPGFVALFADSMVRYAVDAGIDAAVATRAIRQLFLAGGTMMAEGEMTPGDHVREMVDYAGTTAAGLVAMQDLGIPELIAKGLDAAVEKTRRIA
jgi:pyrroline-5-carboxylate reductase